MENASIISQRFRRVLIHSHSNSHMKLGLQSLADYLQRAGAKVRITNRRSYPFVLRCSDAIRKNRGVFRPFADWWWRKQISQVDHVFLWNGEIEIHQSIRHACRVARVPCSIVEVGYFPQKDFFVLDSQGINASSSLMDDSLDWVERKHYDRVQNIRQSHLRGRQWKGGGGYIAVPLQLADDTNIRLNSDFSTMQEFVHHCETKFSNQTIIFKKHPLDTENYDSIHPIYTDGDFLDLAVAADLVYGINSTCLLESVLLGAPTKSVGRGFLSAHAHQLDKLLAALVDKQVPVDAKDMGYWLETYCAKQ